MSRRSEPSPLPPLVRVIDGVLCVGANPWFSCGFCGLRFDTAEHPCCPACAAAAAEIERDHRADMAAWALEHLTSNSPIN